MNKKIKILTLGDMPLSPSGVGTQTKYIVEALLKTGRYKVVSLGGAIKHPNYNPMKVEGHLAMIGLYFLSMGMEIQTWYDLF